MSRLTQHNAAVPRPSAARWLGVAYALTVFVSAFLLFQVQPLISKYILPWFGGTPGVWTTCMLFFQLTLFAGYAYAHLAAARFSGRVQTAVHLMLLVAGLALLPIIPDSVWKPAGDEQPIWRIVSLLAVSVGLPFFILSTTGPLLQHWFSRTHAGFSPYRLYALSNAGSLLALVSYPFVFEPAFSTTRQAFIWSWGFGGFAVLCAVCALGMAFWSGGKLERDPTETAASDDPTLRRAEWAESRPTFGRGLFWFLLAMTPSVLLLAMTNQVCLDVASIPFLWVVPLSLYLLSFILCFDSDRWYSRRLYMPVSFVLVCCTAAVMIAGAVVAIWWQVLVLFGALFTCAMVCHGELAQLRPHPRYLTWYYLVISAGGAAGGLFVGLLAPNMFPVFLELHLGLILFSVLSLFLIWRYYSRNLAGVLIPRKISGFVVLGTILPVVGLLSALTGWLVGKEYIPWDDEVIVFGLAMLVFGIGVLLIGMAKWQLGAGIILCSTVIALAGALTYQVYREVSRATDISRNFYGVLRVQERTQSKPDRRIRELLHGRILHGSQIVEPAKEREFPTTYYGPKSGIGLIFHDLGDSGPLRAGLVGLGAGTLATYGRPGDVFRFYDINPEVVRFASEHFSYLQDCHGKVEIVLGDARLSMEHEEPQQFDVLVLDAFSSDAIPVHLLTVEAFEIYLKHLKQDGVFAIHISNRHFDLRPVVEGLADDFGLHYAVREDSGEKKEGRTFQSSWVLVSREPEPLQCIVDEGALPEQSRRILWTDDSSNLFRVLRHRNPEDDVAKSDQHKQNQDAGTPTDKNTGEQQDQQQPGEASHPADGEGARSKTP